ncbi:hypothetical protein GCM10010124_19240 [Pilimelia terevasa]|uniref:Uncharacterized protein n=1 Tax=Pilimelia terevasa TaxID=53372 RepID=A0A8J3FHP1_9ACTN|nr:hypothetical protein GCM10010124_19240 [Pilimelia terevasa]
MTHLTASAPPPRKWRLADNSPGTGGRSPMISPAGGPAHRPDGPRATAPAMTYAPARGSGYGKSRRRVNGRWAGSHNWSPRTRNLGRFARLVSFRNHREKHFRAVPQ